AVPLILDRADVLGELGSSRQDGTTVFAGECALTDDDQRTFGLGQHVAECVSAGSYGCERVSASTQIFVIVTQFSLFADQGDREMTHALTLADTGVQNSGFHAGIGTDDEQSISVFNAFNGRVEEIGCAAQCRIESGAILTAIDIGGAERSDQAPPRIDFLNRSQIACNSADLIGRRCGNLGGNSGESFRPACGDQTAILADI